MKNIDKIKRFLTIVSDISLGYSDINFFDPQHLEGDHIGFSFHADGYTLITGTEGAWKREWIAIASDGLGDPIIVDTNTPQLTVLSAPHGEGAWRPFIIGREQKVGDDGNEPFFIKKANESRSFVEKHGFPEELLKKR